MFGTLRGSEEVHREWTVPWSSAFLGRGELTGDQLDRSRAGQKIKGLDWLVRPRVAGVLLM